VILDNSSSGAFVRSSKDFTDVGVAGPDDTLDSSSEGASERLDSGEEGAGYRGTGTKALGATSRREAKDKLLRPRILGSARRSLQVIGTKVRCLGDLAAAQEGGDEAFVKKNPRRASDGRRSVCIHELPPKDILVTTPTMPLGLFIRDSVFSKILFVVKLYSSSGPSPNSSVSRLAEDESMAMSGSGSDFRGTESLINDWCGGAYWGPADIVMASSERKGDRSQTNTSPFYGCKVGNVTNGGKKGQTST
jgi:hypothetical protein